MRPQFYRLLHCPFRRMLRQACLLSSLVIAANPQDAGTSSKLTPDIGRVSGSDIAGLRQQYEDTRKDLQVASAQLQTWTDFKGSLDQVAAKLKTVTLNLEEDVRKLQPDGIRKLPNVRLHQDILTRVQQLEREVVDPFYDPLFSQIQPVFSPESAQAQRDISVLVKDVQKPYDDFFDISEYQGLLYWIHPEYATTQGNAGAPAILAGNQVADALVKVFSNSRFQALRDQTVAKLEQASTTAGKKISDLQQRSNTLRSRLSEIDEKIESARTDINSLAIKLGLPLFCITILILFLGSQWLISSQQLNPGTSGSSYSPTVVLELITVLLLTMTILILGLATRIQGEVLGTLLGGISGYVLNRIREDGRHRESQTTR